MNAQDVVARAAGGFSFGVATVQHVDALLTVALACLAISVLRYTQQRRDRRYDRVSYRALMRRVRELGA